MRNINENFADMEPIGDSAIVREAVDVLIRPRPKRMPVWLWFWILNKFVYLEKFYLYKI